MLGAMGWITSWTGSEVVAGVAFLFWCPLPGGLGITAAPEAGYKPWLSVSWYSAACLASASFFPTTNLGSGRSLTGKTEITFMFLNRCFPSVMNYYLSLMLFCEQAGFPPSPFFHLDSLFSHVYTHIMGKDSNSCIKGTNRMSMSSSKLKHTLKADSFNTLCSEKRTVCMLNFRYLISGDN